MIRNFKYNLAIEIVIAAARYASNDEIKKNLEDFNYTGDMGLLKWVDEVQERITPFMERELKDLFRNYSFNAVNFILLIEDKKLKNPDELLKYISEMSGNDYLRMISKGMDIDETEDADIIKKELATRFDEDKAVKYSEFVYNPSETIERISYVLRKFYDVIFIEYEEEIVKVLEKKVEEHREQYEALGELFIKSVIPLGESFWNKYKEVDFYVSNFMEMTASGFSTEDKMFAVYGYRMEFRLKKELVSERRKLLFKVLSDEKRVEILRLISKRHWFGNELAKEIKITTATLSYHMSKLALVGVVSIEEGENNRIYYRLDKDALKNLFDEAYLDIVE